MSEECADGPTTTDTLVALVETGLKGRTVAGDRVYSPRDWPAATSDLPIIKIAQPFERKDSQGPNAPAYDVSSTIQVIATVTLLPAITNDQAAGIAQSALAIVQRQIERALINNYDLYLVISEIVSVDVKSEIRSDGSGHVGELTMDFVMKFYQGTAAFYPIDTVEISELALLGDMINVVDKLGTYPASPDFPYPVAPAPRIEGPDGRVEIGALIQLETES